MLVNMADGKLASVMGPEGVAEGWAPSTDVEH